MSGTLHAFEMIHQATPVQRTGVCPVFGSERFLKKLVVKNLLDAFGDEEAEFSSAQFEGASASWADVMDELSTRTLFGGGPKVVVVDEADGFVKEHRGPLEKLMENPPSDGLLVLVVDSWASNTKLYKWCEKAGVQVQCDPPVIKRGRSKSRDDAKIAKWLKTRASEQYDFELPAAGPAILVELTECNFGRMEQELAKLSLYATDRPLDNNRIREIVGGWPAQTMWSAIDAATEGNAGAALALLDQLLRSGEHPLALLGQMSWSLRRFAEVGELAQRDVRNGRRVDLNATLQKAGFRSWGGEIDNASRRLKQLGRERVSQMNRWLLEADLALKGTHSKPDRGRLVLESLFVKMSSELSPVQAK